MEIPADLLWGWLATIGVIVVWGLVALLLAIFKE